MGKNLRALTAVAVLRGAHFSIYNVLWQPFVLSLGLPVSTLGVLNSIGGGAGLTATLAQALGGWSADRLGRKPFLLAGSVAMLAGYASFVVAGGAGVAALAAAGALLYGLSSVARAANSSITAESVDRDRQGSAFSTITFAFTIPGVLIPAFAGWAADQAGYPALFAASVGIEAIALVLIARRITETKPGRSAPTLKEAVAALVRSAVPPKGLVAFTLACTADATFWSMGYGLLYGMFTDRHGLSPSQVGLLAAAMSASWAVVQLPMGRYVDKHSAIPIMVLSESMSIPLMWIWITQSQFEVLLGAQLLMGVVQATWIPASSTYLARLTEPASRAEAFSRSNVFRGLVGFPAPAIGGLLYAWGGMAAPLAMNLGGIVLTIALLLACKPDHSTSV